MRAPSGFIADTVLLTSPTLHHWKSDAAPTDLALDLIVQAGLAPTDAQARTRLDAVVRGLTALPFHAKTGLFHRLYRFPQPGTITVSDADLSSVDNLHLALALWTVSRLYAGTPVGGEAERLFARMDFSIFLDEKTGLISGNVHDEKPQSWVYHFGSEARSLYSVGYALGLFRRAGADEFLERAMRRVPLEVAEIGGRRILRTWDGGVFQLLLPPVLWGEDLFAPELAKTAHAAAQHILSTDKSLPRAFSATVTRVDTTPAGDFVHYLGPVGIPELQETTNPFPPATSAVPLHALLLVAVFEPLAMTTILQTLEKTGFIDGYGWIVSFGTAPSVFPNLANTGTDKGFELVSLLRILDPPGPCAKALLADAAVSARLTRILGIAEARIKAPSP